eukprot:4912040-Pleurochrysis_carterae.AAC.4
MIPAQRAGFPPKLVQKLRLHRERANESRSTRWMLLPLGIRKCIHACAFSCLAAASFLSSLLFRVLRIQSPSTPELM